MPMGMMLTRPAGPSAGRACLVCEYLSASICGQAKGGVLCLAWWGLGLQVLCQGTKMLQK